MVDAVTPTRFAGLLRDVLMEHGDSLASLWSKPGSEYTGYMRSTILKEVGQKLGLESYCWDYYTLDAIYFAERDSEHFSQRATYAKFIAVAVEHENVAATTPVEMNKLQLFNAQLKVLITYPKSDGQRNVLISKYNKIIKGADFFGDTATLRRQLVVFGRLSDGKPIWEFLVYQSDGLVKFNPA
jgi:hypothetical protein